MQRFGQLFKKAIPNRFKRVVFLTSLFSVMKRKELNDDELTFLAQEIERKTPAPIESPVLGMHLFTMSARRIWRSLIKAGRALDIEHNGISIDDFCILVKGHLPEWMVYNDENGIDRDIKVLYEIAQFSKLG